MELKRVGQDRMENLIAHSAWTPEERTTEKRIISGLHERRLLSLGTNNAELNFRKSMLLSRLPTHKKKEILTQPSYQRLIYRHKKVQTEYFKIKATSPFAYRTMNS